jgi:hypothetical protein
VAVDDGVVGEVFEQHRFAQAVGADHDDVGRFGDEGQGEELFDLSPIALGGPVPIEVGDGFEAADMRIGESTLQGASSAFGLLGLDEAKQPGLVDEFSQIGLQAVELQGEQPLGDAGGVGAGGHWGVPGRWG